MHAPAHACSKAPHAQLPPAQPTRHTCTRLRTHLTHNTHTTHTHTHTRYEDYLDSQVTPADMYYLEDVELARHLVELG